MGKNKSDDSKSNSEVAEDPALVTVEGDQTAYERKQLLAHMASRIVAVIMQDPSPSTNSPEAFAEVAVDVAEAILQKVGL